MIKEEHRNAINEAVKRLPDEPLLLIGIRRIGHVDAFNDTFILYSPYDGIYWYTNEFTTDPGLEYLKNPINPKGTAILMEGVHRDIWSIGLHNGKYKALVQTGMCCVYRDANKDDILDMNANTRDCGYFGINLHHAYNSYRVGKNSAGCQVFRRAEDLNYLLGLLGGKYSFIKHFSYYLHREA